MFKFIRDKKNKFNWFYVSNKTIKIRGTRKFFFILFLFDNIKLLLNYLIDKFFSFIFIDFFYFLNNFFYNKKNFIKDGECFIIGNGPSLDDKDLEKIKNLNVFVINNFLLVNTIKLKYCKCVITDTFYLRNFLKYKKDSFLYEVVSKNLDTDFYFPITFKKILNKQNLIKSDKINYFYELPYAVEENSIKYKLNFNSGIPWSHNVLISSICLAISMGYKKINLLGADTTHHFDKNHFKGSIYTDMLKKRDSLYRDNIKKNLKYRLIDNCENHIGMWSTFRTLSAHKNIKDYADRQGILITNYSKNGILDVYPFDDLK